MPLIRYTLDPKSGPLSFQVHRHVAAGRAEPDVEDPREHDPVTVTFTHPEVRGYNEVHDTVVRSLVTAPGRRGMIGNQTFLQMLEAGSVRFNVVDLRGCGYKGPVPGSLDSALGIDASAMERLAELEREKAEAEAKAKAAEADRELEMLRLKARIAESSRAEAEANAVWTANQVELEAKRAESLRLEAEVAAAKADAEKAKAAQLEAEAAKAKAEASASRAARVKPPKPEPEAPAAQPEPVADAPNAAADAVPAEG